MIQPCAMPESSAAADRLGMAMVFCGVCGTRGVETARASLALGVCCGGIEW